MISYASGNVNEFIPENTRLCACRIQSFLYFIGERNVLLPCPIRTIDSFAHLVGSADQAQQGISRSNFSHAYGFQCGKHILACVIHPTKPTYEGFNCSNGVGPELVHPLTRGHTRNLSKSTNFFAPVRHSLRHIDHDAAYSTTAHFSTHTGLSKGSSKTKNVRSGQPDHATSTGDTGRHVDNVHFCSSEVVPEVNDG